MFSPDQLNGMVFPEKTLCLTFDDGPGDTPGDHPGPKTRRIAEYLKDQNIFATFFMVGRYVEQYPHIAAAVSQMGHIIGNHTYSHPDMPELFRSGGDFVAEVKRTDELIVDWVAGSTVFFRAPYGLWAPELSDQLNRHLTTDHNHIGPFHWDIECKDWAYWRDSCSAESCAEAYLYAIEHSNRGIVLMHDSTADIDQARMNNQTLETIQLLIPQLKSLGYKFIRIDEIPGLPN